MSKLQHLKSSRNKILNSFPTRSFGKDGDIVMCKILGKGFYLCSKISGTWYAANKLQELRNIENTSINNLKVKKLSLPNVINANKKTDKFLVINSGTINHRTNDEVVDDLDIKIKDIDYKTAYCSLGQYTNKEDCEANNGTWYYSENDSHDSSSSTVENQLLTVGQSIGSLDVEPTLLYDGSTLEIKYNSDYDDNWQTSAKDDLLKLTYDSTNYGEIGVASNGNMKFTVQDSKTFGFYEELSNGTKQLRVAINTDTGLFKLFNPDDILDYFLIDINANGATTLLTTDAGGTAGHLTLDPDGDLIVSGADVKVDATKKIYLDGGTDTYIAETSADVLDFYVGNVNMLKLTEALTDVVEVVNSDFKIPAAKKIGFDGGLVGTYITESSDDILDIYVGGDNVLKLSEKGDDGNEIAFGACAGFTQLEPTYDATDTLVDFRHSNKQFVTFGAGNITNLNLYFPLVSGNFIVLLKQDGTGSRTVTNWKAFESDESAADGNSTVKWAGGSAPTLTTDANHVDILSFYWDDDNQICYGVATLDFQF